jgi:hypothetical protein
MDHLLPFIVLLALIGGGFYLNQRRSWRGGNILYIGAALVLVAIVVRLVRIAM